MSITYVMRLFAGLLLILASVACGGTAAESLTPTPAQESTPALETVSPSVNPPLSEATVPIPVPSPTTAPTTETAPIASSSATVPTVLIGNASFTAELAATPEQRTQGLSGRPSLAPGAGMLFIFERENLYNFWMKDMRFPLDMVWVSADCVVVDITQNVPLPEPGQAVANLPTYSPSEPAQYVLEINAGEADAADIRPGDQVEFGGSLGGTYGC